MKALKGLIIAIIMVLIATTSFALDTATINVSAVVQGTCLFNTNTYNMTFPTIIPGTTTGDVTASVTLDFTCNNGTPITLDDVSGLQTMTSGSGPLDYTIDAYVAPAAGTGAAQTLAITGRILQADYDLALADTYTDTLIVNINP